MRQVDEFLKHLGIEYNSPLASVYENFFEHYGVKGMKWGVRKDRRRSSGPGRTTTKKKLKAASRIANARRSNTFTNQPQNIRLSSRELQSRIQRLRWENEYRQLTQPQRQEVETWQKRLLTSIPEKISNAAVDVSVQVGKTYLEQALKVKINDKVDTRFRVPTKQSK